MGSEMCIRDSTGIGQGGRIIIEDDCDIAMGVKFICETHEMCNGGGKTSR